MPLWEIILFGIVQGLTEFLPVSSSGHLVVVNAVLEALGNDPVKDLVEVSIVLHLGTLVAVIIFYRKELMNLLGVDRRVIPLLVIGTIPAAIVGMAFKEGLPESTELWAKQWILENTLLAGFMFPVTALVLLWITKRTAGETDYPELTWQNSLAIGFAQAFAILPGISRSGLTIAAGLGLGLNRQAAATYAFLLAIPTIGGAGLIEGIEAYQKGTTGTSPFNLAIGFLVSFVVGWVALKLLVSWVQKGQLARFSYYLLPLGIAVVVWQLLS